MSKQSLNIRTLVGFALLFTIFLLLTILVIAHLLNNARRDVVSDEIQQTYNSLSEMQTFLLMSQTYGNDMACIAFKEKLENLDITVWNLGQKLDQYRVATEELQKNEFYQQQKKTFNEQQIVYQLLLRNLQERCDYNQVLISFFYRNSEDCPKCDDQSFVLTDINKDFDPQIAIFSYDVDLNLTSVNLLDKYYKLSDYPCVVIDDVPYCGIRDKDFVVQKICERNSAISECLKWQQSQPQTPAE